VYFPQNSLAVSTQAQTFTLTLLPVSYSSSIDAAPDDPLISIVFQRALAPAAGDIVEASPFRGDSADRSAAPALAGNPLPCNSQRLTNAFVSRTAFVTERTPD
jgi:hypothetical protein